MKNLFALFAATILCTASASELPAWAKSDWVEEGEDGQPELFNDPAFEDIPNPFSDPAFSAFSNSKPTSSVETKDGKTTLKIGVEHARKLEPLPAELSVGSVFDNSLLELNDSERLKWYKIPSWFTGKWKRNRETTVFSYDYATRQTNRQSRSFMSEQVAEFGMQLDREGHIWHCNLIKHGLSNRGSFRSIALIKYQEPVVVNQQEVILREIFNIINVMNASDVITQSYSIESLTRYRPVGAGQIETFASIKAYNADGTPKALQQNVSYERKIEPMKIVDEFKGRDVREDFISFLKENGSSKLIPAELRSNRTASSEHPKRSGSSNRAVGKAASSEEASKNRTAPVAPPDGSLEQLQAEPKELTSKPKDLKSMPKEPKPAEPQGKPEAKP